MPPDCWKMRCCSVFVAAALFASPPTSSCSTSAWSRSTDDALVHRYRLLTSMPGVGAVLACTLIALLPELGGMSRKQVAALVGVAPYAFESGTLKGRRCIWGGRAHIRQVLYMAAMTATNRNPALKLFHDRLKGAGKLPKVVIVAVSGEMVTEHKSMVCARIACAGPLYGWYTAAHG